MIAEFLKGLVAAMIVGVIALIVGLTILGTWRWDGETKTLRWERHCEPLWITVDDVPGAKPIDIRCGEAPE